MNFTLKKRKETGSSALTQTLLAIFACSAFFTFAAFAADPTWWSSSGTGSRPAVMTEQIVTNAGVVTTNYVPDNYAAVTQGQLKQFTVRAIDELNSHLTNGAGLVLNTMATNWKQDYATNDYGSLTNPYAPYNPRDYTVMTVGQVKYIGSNVWVQLVGAGYTNAIPSWMAPTNTDNNVAVVGQLKEVFNFDLSSSSPTAPLITSASTASATVGVAFSYTITATHSPTGYSMTGSLPGLSINTSSGVISGTPSAAGTYTVTLGATNAHGSGSATLTLIVNPAVPVITSATTASGTAGVPFSYTITASNSPTSFTASGLPTGLSVNTTTGAITGTPAAGGTTTITLGAANAGGSATPVSLTLTVSSPSVPVITSGTTATGDVGVGFSYTITASNSPTSFSASGLPGGLSINTSTGVISGTPTATGSSTITLGAANAGGSATPVTLSLTVNSVTAPVITSGLTATGLHGVAFSYTVSASNSPTSYGASGLPAGLSINTSTGVISGTPSSSSSSTVSATISATNLGGTGSATLIFTMNPPAPVISSSTMASANEGSAFSYAITASNSPTSFSASGLPVGLSISTTSGVISGTPTVTGTSTVTLSATTAGGTGMSTLTLTINLPEPVPVINSSTSATGDVGVAFSYTITTSTTGSSVTFGASGLPGGLSINSSTGVISGSPTTAGSSTVTLSASNAEGTGTEVLTLTINPAGAPVISSATTETYTSGSALTYTITASNSPTSFSASGLPAGLSINTSSGAITGTPTVVGTSIVVLTATNSLGTSTADLTMTVNPPAPVISSATTASGAFGMAITPYTITASNSPTSFGATGLPPGLYVDTSTGKITGTPTAGGTWTVVLSATNAGGTGMVDLVFTISSGASAPITTRSVASGKSYSLILKSDGTVWAAGYNGDGELGNGGNADSASYTQVTGFPSGTIIIAIAAAYDHGIALTSTGTVWSWGFGESGELGNGSDTDSNVAVQVYTSSGPLTGITAIAGADDFSMALDSSGNVWTWGLGYLGELGYGDGGYTSSDVAKEVSQTTGLTNVVAISGGTNHALAIKGDGTVWAWGDNSADELGIEDGSVTFSSEPVQVSTLSGMTSVAAGDNYSIALKSDGTVWAWGDNSGGYLGNGFTGGNSMAPVSGMGTGPAQVLNLSGVTAISGHGGDHTLAVKSDGTVWAWGANKYGQLGDGTTTGSSVPVIVSNLSDVIALGAAYSQNIAIKSDQTVWAWGYNFYDSVFGAGSYASTQTAQPAPVSNLSGITQIAGTKSHYLALKSDGTVWTWDDITPGEISDGASITGSSSGVQVSGFGGSTISAISCGVYYNLALDSSGRVWSWGRNNSGQLGNGTSADNQTPGLVSGLSGVTITAIAAGATFGMALDSGGHVWTWGYNGDGELGNGDGSGTNTDTAAEISSSALSGVTKITASDSRALALKSDGTLWTWGFNYEGELGTGSSYSTNPTPAQVTGLSGKTITDMTIGLYHAMALDSGGHLWGWGVNTDGQLGLEDTTNTFTPTELSSISGVTKIQTGEYSSHCVALKSDGTLWAWGDNVNGQLGVGSYGAISGSPSPTGSDAPVQVIGLSGVTITGLACGSCSTVALTSAGTVLEWGDMSYEPLGFSVPIEVANLQTVPVPTITPSQGSYSSSQTISISAALTGTIHYTLDGTEPTSSSPTYSGSFTLSSDALVSAEVFSGATPISSVGSAQYYIADTSDAGLPTAATGLTVTLASSSQINLSWTLSGLVNYNEINVYRSSDGGSTWQLLTTLGSTVTSYNDVSVQTGVNYEYYVGTRNSSGESDTSHSSSVSPTSTSLTITLTTPSGAVSLP